MSATYNRAVVRYVKSCAALEVFRSRRDGWSKRITRMIDDGVAEEVVLAEQKAWSRAYYGGGMSAEERAARKERADAFSALVAIIRDRLTTEGVDASSLHDSDLVECAVKAASIAVEVERTKTAASV